MGEFASASPIRRRQILEEALAAVLTEVGPIMRDEYAERCVGIELPTPDGCLAEHRLVSLWVLAGELEWRLV